MRVISGLEGKEGVTTKFGPDLLVWLGCWKYKAYCDINYPKTIGLLPSRGALQTPRRTKHWRRVEEFRSKENRIWKTCGPSLTDYRFFIRILYLRVFIFFVLPVPSGTIGTNLILAWSYKSLFLSFQSWINISFLRWTITSCPINSPFILTLTTIPAFCIISRLAKRIKRKIKEREQKRDGKSSILPQANAKFLTLLRGLPSKQGRLVIEQHRVRRELEFDSQNELPDAGFFWPVEWTERRFLTFTKIGIISMPRYDIIKQ